ncbi:unnamed protein product [Paramecium sonneborni]|uniref:Histidine kinase n=1 Tax=Paramecium sonneborni TaxID=65129 RepID=A0A8S1MRX7_9CILI|nr:unnamed protein product [Paramecium sonneborni]
MQEMNDEKVYLFLLPPLLYDHLNKNRTKKLYFQIFKFLHLIIMCIWKMLDNLNRGQTIIITFILLLFAFYFQKKQEQQLKNAEGGLEDTINIKTSQDTDRIQELQNSLVSIIKLDGKLNLMMCNSRAQDLLKNINIQELLNSPLQSVDKQTKLLMQEQFSCKFPSIQDLKDVQQNYSLNELLEQLQQLQKFPYEFEVFSIRGYNDLHLKVFYFEPKSFTIIIQNMEEYNLQIKKVFTQTTMQQLFKSFSHEYNTSLNYILALAQVAECHEDVPQNIQEQFFKPILVNGKVMHSMVLDMMDYNSILGKTFSLQVGVFNIQELIIEVISLFKDQISKKNLEIKTDFNSKIKQILSDRNRIKQILINLVSNAQKFTLQGSISLKVETCQSTKNQQYVVFHVEDTGIGMKKQEQDRLTLLLQSGVPSIQKISKNTAGFGLGLFISNKIAEALSQQRYEKGGGLRFETQTGKGFHCWFSVYPQTVSPGVKSNNPKSPLIVLNKKIVIDTRQTEVNAGIETCKRGLMRTKFSHLLNNNGQIINESNQIRPRRPQSQIRFVQELIDAVSIETVNNECSIEDYQTRVKYIKSQQQQQQQQSFLMRSNQSLIECRCPNILIVDDEQINILALSILLEQLGFTSDQVFNGKECVDLIYSKQKKTNCLKCFDKQYQLIFMDINMPLLDGWEASRQIKKRFSIPIIACTAFTDNQTKEQCYQNGIDYYLSKPVKKESLIQEYLIIIFLFNNIINKLIILIFIFRLYFFQIICGDVNIKLEQQTKLLLCHLIFSIQTQNHKQQQFMLNNCGEFLRRIDQFGASYKPSYAYGEVQYKTSLGGLLSIILYGLSLAYLVYEIVLWRSGRILPKITSLHTEIETYELSFDKVTIASFCLRRHKSITNQIDPFDPKHIILLPMLYEIIDDELQKPLPLLSTKKSEKHQTILIELKDVILSNNEQESVDHPNREYMLTLQQCVQHLLPSGWLCANEDTIKEFFNQKQNQLTIQTFVNQYNTSTRQLELVEQDYYASIDNKTTYFSQITICTSNVSIDTGFLLESTEIMEFPSSTQQYIQQMDLDYFTHTFHEEVYVVFEFELGTLQSTIFIEYPKISEVLANIGSIISFFLFFSHVAYIINEKNLELKVVRTLIEMYYPQVKEITFIKNLFGKITQIRYQNQKVALTFLESYKKLQKIASAKLCLTNTLYEISRLQFIIRSISDKQILKSCHDIGIRLKSLEIEPDIEKQNGIKIDNLQNNQELKQEIIDNNSIDDQNRNILRIIPQTLGDGPSQIIQLEQLNQSQSLFLGKNLQPQESLDDDQKLTDEDFYILMQQQPKIKELNIIDIYETVTPKVQTQNNQNNFSI